MSEIKSLIDYDVKENIDHIAICVKFAMMSKQIEKKDKEIKKLNNIINKVVEYIESKVVSNNEVIDQLRKTEVREILDFLKESDKYDKNNTKFD